jgi:hypothetical protein
VAASHAQRVVWLVQAANGQIPEERRRLPASSIAGPIFENVKYLEDGNPLLELYKNLLTSAMDRERENTAHPAFVEIIKHLSGDEAVWLYHIIRGRFEISEREMVYHLNEPEESRTTVVRSYNVPFGLVHKDNLPMYKTHLLALNLIGVLPRSKQEDKTDSRGEKYVLINRDTRVFLSEFGQLFAEACIPKEWEFADRSPED